MTSPTADSTGKGEAGGREWARKEGDAVNVAPQEPARMSPARKLTVAKGSGVSKPDRGGATGRAEGGVKGWDDEGRGFGAYMREKNRKLREQFQAEAAAAAAAPEATSSRVLGGVVVWVDGRTEPGRLEVKRIMAKHGGVFETYYGGRVTHVVAEQLAAATKKKLGGKVKVVRAAWLVDSVREGKLKPEADYAVQGMGVPGQKSVRDMFKTKAKRK